jgi:hypothetical protein
MRSVKAREGEELSKESVAGRESVGVVSMQPELLAETKDSTFVKRVRSICELYRPPY